MKKISSKAGIIIFYIFDALLLLILLFAFLPFSKKKEGPQKETLSFLKEEDVKQIKSISIKKNDKKIKLFLRGSIWLGKDWNFDAGAAADFIWPADTQSVSNLIEIAAKRQDIFLLSTKNSSWENYQLKKDDAIELSFFADEKEEEPLLSLFFGKRNLLASRIAFRSWEDSNVYECYWAIENYLNLDSNFWADPFLYPQCLTHYSRNQSESLLRHGNLVNLSPAKHLIPDLILSKDFENGSSASFAIYKKDASYVVIPSFKASPVFSDEDVKALQDISYRYSVSSVTLERFKEDLK